MEVMLPESIIVNGLSTPPSTDIKSSVRVVRMIQVFKDCYAGLLPDYWTVYPLSGAEYEEVFDQLEHDDRLSNYVGAHMRYDFDPIRGVLIFRMGSITHDTFALRLGFNIIKKLEYLAETEIETQPFIKKIKQIAGKLFFPIDDDQQKYRIGHIPNIMFRHKDTIWPSIIIEVSNSRKKRYLPYLADNYILGSDGNIKVMVGIDLEYRNSKRASFSIWQLKTFIDDRGETTITVEQVVNDQFFRDAEGHHIPSSIDLKLPLSYFAVEEVTPGIPIPIPNHSIVIDSHYLYKTLGEVEDIENRMRTGQGITCPPLVRKYRERTPPKQLTLADVEERQLERKLDDQHIISNPAGVSAENSSRI